MKIFCRGLTIVLIFLNCHSASFRNLDFQSPNIKALSASIPGGVYSVNDVIPGWRLEYGGINQNLMFYNNVSLLFPSARLYGSEIPRLGDTFGFGMKSGIFADGSNDIMGAASIYQIGQVPESARSLQFQAAFRPSIEDLHVTLNGQLLQLIEFEQTGIYYRYGAEVSPWAGETAELRFTVGPGTYPDGAAVELAAIQFSSTPVPAIPEPSTWALLITGLAALAWNHRRRGNRRV